jgi:glutamate synthase (ferredoxin)
VKVLPHDYARVQAALKKAEANGLSGDDAIMAAFEENIRDLARVGGG